WIGRHGRFERDTWNIGIAAHRVLNWLRHYPLIVEGATPEQAASVARALAAQVQMLKLRGPLSPAPVEALLAATALVGVALSDESRRDELAERVRALKLELDRQIDAGGMHRSRSARVQLDLLGELVSVRAALKRDFPDLAADIVERIDRMHRALD